MRSLTQHICQFPPPVDAQFIEMLTREKKILIATMLMRSCREFDAQLPQEQ
jgi:hypothetical protein